MIKTEPTWPSPASVVSDPELKYLWHTHSPSRPSPRWAGCSSNNRGELLPSKYAMAMEESASAMGVCHKLHSPPWRAGTYNHRLILDRPLKFPKASILFQNMGAWVNLYSTRQSCRTFQFPVFIYVAVLLTFGGELCGGRMTWATWSGQTRVDHERVVSYFSPIFVHRLDRTPLIFQISLGFHHWGLLWTIGSSSIPSQEDVRVGVEFGIRGGALHLIFPSPFHSPLSFYTTHTSILSHFRRLQLLVRPLSPTRTPCTASPSTSSWPSLLVRFSQVPGCCCQLHSSPHGISLANRMCVLIIGGDSSSRTRCSPRQHVCNKVSWCGLIDYKKKHTLIGFLSIGHRRITQGPAGAMEEDTECLARFPGGSALLSKWQFHSHQRKKKKIQAEHPKRRVQKRELSGYGDKMMEIATPGPRYSKQAGPGLGGQSFHTNGLGAQMRSDPGLRTTMMRNPRY
jgi:hypothetical protein